MKLNDAKFWLVSDPHPASEWVDVFSGPHPWDFLVRAIIGRGRIWGADHEAVYDSERDARKDAEARWEKEQDRRAKDKKAYTYDRG